MMLLRLTHVCGKPMLVDPNQILAILPYNEETTGVTLQKKNGEFWTIEILDTIDAIIARL